MNEELLNTLIAALRLSPENAILRVQVVSGLVETEQWADLESYAAPLLDTEHRAFALSVMARATLNLGDADKAAKLYREAVALDRDLIDEAFEAALEPEDKVRIPLDDVETRPMRFMPYCGPRITFADVGGMEGLKEQIRMNIIYPFQHPDVFAAYGKKAGGGIMMYGPPGCGKTYIARATAGEMGAAFYILELSEVLDMWMGETEKRLNELFETARANRPSIIFIDEIDAIGTKRSGINSASIRWSVSQLLTEMDGITSKNDQLLVMGATNAPWDVDAAFRRPGRFDRMLFVPPPDAHAREEVLRLHSQGRKVDAKLAWEQIAKHTDHFSGADLAALVDRACEIALGEAIKSGRMRDVGLADFKKSVNTMRPSTIEWLRRAKNYVTYANQDGFYDDLAEYLSATKL